REGHDVLVHLGDAGKAYLTPHDVRSTRLGMLVRSIGWHEDEARQVAVCLIARRIGDHVSERWRGGGVLACMRTRSAYGRPVDTHSHRRALGARREGDVSTAPLWIERPGQRFSVAAQHTLRAIHIDKRHAIRPIRWQGGAVSLDGTKLHAA